MENTNEKLKPWEGRTPIFSEEYLKKENEKAKAERKRLYTLELVKAIACGESGFSAGPSRNKSQIVTHAKEIADECEKAGLLV